MVFKIARWANVIVTPDDNNKRVFTKGKPQISKGCIPLGGHTQPTATEGDRLAWKKAQKKAKKNIISETIKRIIPYRNPRRTEMVWYPRPDSQTTVRNHANKTVEKKNHAIWKTILSNKWRNALSDGWR